MKTKLLRKLKKRISSIQKDVVITPMVFNPQLMKHVPLLVNGSETLYVVNTDKPVAPQIYRELDLRSTWFMKYWKKSRWRGLIELTAAAENISLEKAAVAALEKARIHWKKCRDNCLTRSILQNLNKYVPKMYNPAEVIVPSFDCSTLTTV